MEKIKKKLNSKSVAGYVFTAPLLSLMALFFLLYSGVCGMAGDQGVLRMRQDGGRL